MTGQVLFDPLLPLWALGALAALCALAVSVALWRGLSGWAFRGLAGLVLLAALSGCEPSCERTCAGYCKTELLFCRQTAIRCMMH